MLTCYRCQAWPCGCSDGCTILQGDCLTILPLLAPKSVHLLAADPPYKDVLPDAWDRAWKSDQAFLTWTGNLLDTIAPLLTDNASLYWFASARMAGRVEGIMRERFAVLNSIVWANGVTRSGAGSGIDVPSLRAYWPASERIIFAEMYRADQLASGEAGYAAQCETLRGFIFEPLRAYLAGEFAALGWTTARLDAICETASMARKHYTARSQWALPTPEHYAKLQAAARVQESQHLRREYEDLRREYEDLRRPMTLTKDAPWGDVWTFPLVQDRQHPAQKPIAMLEHIVSASSRAGNVVLDPFMGSGTALLAAKTLGRRAIGIEREERYCAIAAQRLLQEALPFAQQTTPQPLQVSLL